MSLFFARFVTQMLLAGLFTSLAGYVYQTNFYQKRFNWWPKRSSCKDQLILFGLFSSVLAWPTVGIVALSSFAYWLAGAWIAWALFSVATCIVLMVLVLDVDAYSICSFHLVDYRAFITLDQPGRYIGGWKRLTPVAYRCLTYGAIQFIVVSAIHRLAISPYPLLTWALGAIFVSIVFSPCLLWTLSRPAIAARILDVLFFRPPNAWVGHASKRINPTLTELQKHLEGLQLSLVSIPAPRMDAAECPSDAPSIVILIVESWRADALNEFVMPLLWARSRDALRATTHYSNGNATHTGTFAVLYGQNPLLMKATLETGAAPALTSVLSAAGYRTTARALREKWLGLEHIFADHHYTVFDKIEEIEWAEADQRTFEFIKQSLRSKGQTCAIGQLLCTHFPYVLPQGHPDRLHLDQYWNFRGFQTTGRQLSNRKIWKQRYENTLGWLDQQLDSFLNEIDLSHTVVVITGDHGESHGEDQTWLHSSRLSDAQTRTPLVIIGAGIESRHSPCLSSSIDIAPTLVRLAGCGSSTPWPGVDLLHDEEHSSVCLVDFLQRELCLIDRTSKDRLQIVIDRQTGSCSTGGFFDTLGELQPADWQPSNSADFWVARANRELLGIGRITNC